MGGRRIDRPASYLTKCTVCEAPHEANRKKKEQGITTHNTPQERSTQELIGNTSMTKLATKH
jgi:hypothetical protein